MRQELIEVNSTLSPPCPNDGGKLKAKTLLPVARVDRFSKETRGSLKLSATYEARNFESSYPLLRIRRRVQFMNLKFVKG